MEFRIYSLWLEHGSLQQLNASPPYVPIQGSLLPEPMLLLA